MTSAPKPKNENERLNALRSYSILDTLPEESYDEITQIASFICQTPIALISLVDKDRQWFKSKIGIEAAEVSRDFAFCAHAILSDEIFYIPDATKDKRFSDNPLVTGAPNINFYAGIPLKSTGGYNLGTLCVVDIKARELSTEQKSVLTKLGRQVSALLELRAKINELSNEKEITKTMNQFFELSMDMLCVAGTDGYFKKVSPAFTEILGYEPNELYSTRMLDFIHPADKKITIAEFRKLAKGAGSNIFSNRVRTKDKKWKKLSWKTAASADGKFYAIARDITETELLAQNIVIEKKKTEEASLAKTAVLDAVGFAVISTDLTGTIASFNLTAEKLLGYSASELIGKANPGLFHEPSEIVERAEELTRELGRKIEPGFEVFVAKAKMEMTEEKEWIYVHKNGFKFPVDLHVSPLRNSQGELTGFLETAKDKSLLKYTQTAMRKANEQAINASKAKSSFLAKMSHELRTPMNAILGYSDLLLEEVDSSQKETLADIQKIKSSGEHLLNLINQILDISKVEAGKMEIHKGVTPLSELTEKIELLLGPTIAKNKNKLHIDISKAPAEFETDIEKFKQILINLLSNSAKFTTGGLIKLCLYTEINSDGSWLVSEVSDDGIGIPENKLETIFDEFSQVDDSTIRQYGGTGLGLSISRNFAKILGGTLSVESKIGKGSTFKLVLPNSAIHLKKRVA